MFAPFTAAPARVRVLLVRLLVRIGFSEQSFHVILAVIIGMLTAGAAVAIHELIAVIRHTMYGHIPEDLLYGRYVWLLIALPAAGGLAVAIFSRYLLREREGHGIEDVLEAVFRSSGIIKVRSALGKIITAAMTIGSGGSAGAEGPIVYIGAGISSGIGQVFRVPRQSMTVLIGCGSAAGISAIFNSPIGGLLFALEVILRDFSLRTITPVVIASVIANFTTKAIFNELTARGILHEQYNAIFYVPGEARAMQSAQGFDLAHSGHFALLGLMCGLVGVWLIRTMHATQEFFSHLKVSRLFKPMIGGILLGLIGLVYIIVLGHGIMGREKPIPFEQYEMPSFFGEGYGAVRPMLSRGFYGQYFWIGMVGILAFLCFAKVIGTALTLGSGGSGGIIAPALFLGTVTGGTMGVIFVHAHIAGTLTPEACALVAMSAVLSAAVHAPLASMLILFELTQNPYIVLPGMLTTIIAAAVSQLMSRDSIYTLDLRQRGIRVGSGADITLLRRLTVEQVNLEPAMIVKSADPLQHVLDLAQNSGTSDFVVYDHHGAYAGMILADDIKTALFQREAIPLLTVGEVVRTEIPLVSYSDDLGSVLDRFSLHDTARLPVAAQNNSGHVIGLISRASLMRRYQRALAEA